MNVEDQHWHGGEHAEQHRSDGESTRHCQVAPLLPTAVIASSQVLIDRGETHAQHGDVREDDEKVIATFAVEQRRLRQVVVEQVRHAASEETDEQLADVHEGHDGEVECAWTVSKGLQAEKDEHREQTTGDAEDEDGQAGEDVDIARERSQSSDQ